MQLHFRVYKDYSRIDTLCLQMYFRKNDEIYVVKDLVIEKYQDGTVIEPINRLKTDFVVDEDNLKRMSKELWHELDDDSAYLKGELKATKEHLTDMRTLVFADRNRVLSED